MPKSKAAIVPEDNPELTGTDFARMVPFAGLPPAMQKALTGPRRGPQKIEKKVPVTIRLSPEVVAVYKATGNGWQTRMDTVLRDSLKHPLLRVKRKAKEANAA